MGRKPITLILILLFVVSLLTAFYLYPLPNSTMPTFSSVTLGKTEYGDVIRDGPYGNVTSPNRVVYIVGVHPLEHNAHEAIIESVKTNDKSLKNCYYIYRINVTQDASDYNKGRANGQNLANRYAIPDIKNQSIKLVIDVHSNEGNYQLTKFLFIPKQSAKTEKIALQIKNQTNWLNIYSPPDPTSPQFVTIPLLNSGIPSMIYETYTYEPYEQTKKQANEIVLIVDKLGSI